MTIRKVFGFITVLVSAAGCTSPVIKGNSVPSQKQLSFPKVGVQSVVRSGAVAALYADYQSSHDFRLTKPLNMTVMMVSRIAVTTDEHLLESEIDGETVYCTTNKTYIDPLTGPWANACFRSTSPEKFSSVTYRPGAVWLSKALSPEADFVSWESQIQGQVKPLKRELVFEGSQDGVLMFSERIYGKSLDTPSVIKPLMAQIPSLPTKASLDGMEINVLRVEGNALTFEVINPWH